jgi:peptidoglycan biosynthesis protein MviN/MurJ (putative lipid II flippase)
MGSHNRKALVGTVVGSAFGFLLPFALTARFTAGPETDAYLFAYALAIFSSTIFSGVMEANFLPIARSQQKAGRAAFLKSVSKASRQTSIVAILLYAVLFAVSVFLVDGHGDWSSTQKQACLISTGALSVFAVLTGVNGVTAASLYSLDDFLGPTASIAVRSMLPMAALPFLSVGFTSVWIVAVLVSIGEVLRTVFLWARLRRKSRRIPAPKGALTEAIPSVWSAAAPHSLNMAVLAVSPLIDRTFAATLTAGSITVLDLGEKILFVPITAFSAVFVLVASARWASHVAEAPHLLPGDFRQTTSSALLIATATGLGFCVLVAAATFLWPGNRTAGVPDGQLRLVVLALMIGLPFAVLAGLCSRLITSTRRTRVLPFIAVLAVVTNAAGDFLGVSVAGLYGIALASTVTRAATALVMLWLVVRYLRTSEAEEPAHSGRGSEAAHSVTSDVPAGETRLVG